LGPQIRVNCVSPEWIAHQAKVGKKDHLQHPVGRVGRVEDIAAIVAFLLSDASGFTTGQNIVVDGGMTRKMIYV
ncbi:MAG TPA: SDR family oxidoreductase, partial [Burkholderiales bacterium]